MQSEATQDSFIRVTASESSQAASGHFVEIVVPFRAMQTVTDSEPGTRRCGRGRQADRPRQHVQASEGC